MADASVAELVKLVFKLVAVGVAWFKWGWESALVVAVLAGA
jgi:hypothetical protein